MDSNKPIRIVHRIDPYCRLNEHNKCEAVSGLNIVGKTVVFVCSCDCHKEK